MLITHEIYKHIKSQLKQNLIVPDLFAKNLVAGLEKLVETKTPLIISGDPGVGKTAGVQYFAYTNKLDITLINASDEMRVKEGQDLLRSQLLRPNKKLKLVVLDEVEKGSNLEYISKMVEINRKTSNRTNTVLVCITNHYWKLGVLKTAFGAFHEQIKSPHKGSMKKGLRTMGVQYDGPIIKDLRFLNNILKNSKTKKSPAISDNTFEAINKFLEAPYEKRNVIATMQNLNAPFWKWLLANFHHGTFAYEVNNRMTYPKHNTAMFHRINEVLSKAAMYNSYELLNFIIPPIKKPYILHPSTLSKRNKS